MANGIGSLPTMNNPRLITLQKHLNQSRKSIAIVNDKLKESLQRLEKAVDKNKQSDSFKMWQETEPVRQKLVEINALRKCLKNRRQSSTLELELSPRNGVYDGASLNSMRREITQIITNKCPVQRRKRKAETLQKTGYQEGRLIYSSDSRARLNDILSRPQGKRPVNVFKPSKHINLKRELHIAFQDQSENDPTSRTSSSCSFSIAPDDESYDDFDDQVSWLSARKPKAVSEPNTSRTGEQKKSSAVLVLPPIKAGKYTRTMPEGKKNTAVPQKPHLTRRVSSFGPY